MRCLFSWIGLLRASHNNIFQRGEVAMADGECRACEKGYSREQVLVWDSGFLALMGNFLCLCATHVQLEICYFHTIKSCVYYTLLSSKNLIKSGDCVLCIGTKFLPIFSGCNFGYRGSMTAGYTCYCLSYKLYDCKLNLLCLKYHILNFISMF